MKTADSLRQSIQAMARQPAGEARNRSIDPANKALLDTQQAMISACAPDPRSGAQAMGAADKHRGGQPTAAQ